MKSRLSNSIAKYVLWKVALGINLPSRKSSIMRRMNVARKELALEIRRVEKALGREHRILPGLGSVQYIRN